MLPSTVVCWRWKPKPGYRSSYPPETVNILRAMVARHFQHPHTFICVTDDARGIDPRVKVIPSFEDFAGLPSPHGGKNPSCYRRLRMFHPEAAQWFGQRFVSLDLDVVITGDLTPVWNRAGEIVLWGDTNPQPGSHYNGSMILMTAGSRSQVWTDFDPAVSPRLAMENRSWGSDQGWISYKLGPREAKWSKLDGVYSYRNHIEKRGKVLPENAKVVSWHGRIDPWTSEAKQIPWVRQHYSVEAEHSCV